MSLVMVGNIGFIGGCEVVHQHGQPSFSGRKTYEPDEAVKVMQGSVDNVMAYFDALALGTPLNYLDGNGQSVSKNLWLREATKSDHPCFPELTLSYVGFRGVIPPPHAIDSLAEQSVTTTKTINNSASPLDGLTVTLTYRYFAARTQWTGYEIVEPNVSTPPRTTTNDTTNPFDATRFIGRTIGGAPGTTILLADFIALMNTLTVTYRVGDYVRDPIIPGKLWRWSVCVDRVIVPA